MGHGRTLLCTLVACLAALLLLAAGASALPPATTTFVVNDSGDASGASCAPAVAGCTLRSAIEQANATSAATPVAIHFALASPTVTLSGTDLPAITRTTAVNSNGTTIIDGCAPSGVPPCITLQRGASGPVNGLATAGGSAGVTITGLTVTGFTSGVLLQGDSSTVGGSGNTGHANVFTGNANGVRIWGGDDDLIAGSWFGVAKDGTTTSGQGNQRAIRIIGTALGGQPADRALRNVVGGASDSLGDPAGCTGRCNLIVNSSVAGVDLNGTAASEWPAGPPPSPLGDLSGGTTIEGNWIGYKPELTSAASGNDVGVLVGAAGHVSIGYGDTHHGNDIAGNRIGVDQSGAGELWLDTNFLGLDPTGDTSLPNTEADANLTGSAGDHAVAWHNQFGPSPIGLALSGPGGEAYGNILRRPMGAPATFSTAAVIVGPHADHAFVGGTATGGLPSGCLSLLDLCNSIGGTGPGAPGIWLQGADHIRILGNAIGSMLSFVPSLPLAGPPIRITDTAAFSSSDVTIGGGQPKDWNALERMTGPAVDVEGHATGVAILDNIGFATTFADPAAGLFTDLVPATGPGNGGPVNDAIQPPVVRAVTTGGISGTATPGATIRVLQQQRADDPSDPEPGKPPPEGYTFPIDPGATTAAPDGSWSIVFTAALRRNQKVMASQATASGSSEYTAPQGAAKAPDLPTVAITDGPSGTVPTTAATFTFTTTTPGATFECAIDGSDLAPCTSPYTTTVDAGLHQFRVRARLGAAAGLPASRVWVVELPAVPPPGGTATKPSATKPAAIALSAIAMLPSNRRCVSRRSFRIRLRAPKGVRMTAARVTLNGGHARTYRGHSLSTLVSLRGLPKGTVRVSVRVTLSDGRVVTASRTYRTCTIRKAKRR